MLLCLHCHTRSHTHSLCLRTCQKQVHVRVHGCTAHDLDRGGRQFRSFFLLVFGILRHFNFSIFHQKWGGHGRPGRYGSDTPVITLLSFFFSSGDNVLRLLLDEPKKICKCCVHTCVHVCVYSCVRACVYLTTRHGVCMGRKAGGSQYNHCSRNGPMCSNAAFTVSLSTIKAATKNREEGVVWGGGG